MTSANREGVDSRKLASITCALEHISRYQCRDITDIRDTCPLVVIVKGMSTVTLPICTSETPGPSPCIAPGAGRQRDTANPRVPSTLHSRDVPPMGPMVDHPPSTVPEERGSQGESTTLIMMPTIPTSGVTATQGALRDSVVMALIPCCEAQISMAVPGFRRRHSHLRMTTRVSNPQTVIPITAES